MTFKPGQSGNPSGRPKKLLPDGRSITDLARAYTDDAINALADVLKDAEAPHSAKISAASVLIDRGWGRASQSVQISGDNENPLSVVTKIELTGPR